MQGTKHCSSCKNTKPAGDFIHPRTGKDKKTCAECIMKRSAAAKRKAPVDATATLQLHTTRLDDHEQRIACVEETLYDYDAAGAPPAPDAPGAGDGTFTKSQLRRQKRKNKKAARAAARALDFVLVGDDAASDSTELDSLASTHSCVRALIEENRQLSAGLRGMRLLMRDPSLLQRVGRGLIGRSRAKSRFAAVRKIQVLVRRRAKCKFVAATTIQASCARGPPCITLRRKCLRAFTQLQGRERIRVARRVCHHKRLMKASIVIAAAWRRYHILSTTLFGKLLSKTRAAARLEKELKIVKREKDEAQTKLTKANELLAANERQLKNAVHATLCANNTQRNKWRESIKVGDSIDAKDSEGRWFDSRVVEVDGDRVKVHFNGWSSRWDTWFAKSDKGIQPLLSRTDDWRRLRAGDAVEIRDISNERSMWFAGKVTRVEGTRVLVRRPGVNVGQQWVETLCETSSEAICKLGTHLKTYRKLYGNSNDAERPSEVKGASPLMRGLSQFLHEIMNLGCEADISDLQPAVAQLITKDLKVEVKGDEEGVFSWTDESLKKGSAKKSFSAKIIQVKDGGYYEVEFDNVNSGTKGKEGYVPTVRRTLRATQFRIL